MLFRAHARDTVLETPYAGNRPNNNGCPYPGRQIAVKHAATHHIPLRVVACAGRPLQLCVKPISLQLMSELYPPRRNHLQELAVLKQTQAALSACALWQSRCLLSMRFRAHARDTGARNAICRKQAKQCCMPVPWALNTSAARSNASHTTARGRLRWQASPAGRRTNQACN